MKSLLTIVLATSLFALTACAGGSYSRGIFEGRVSGQTEATVIDQVGKPDVAETSDEKVHKFVYKSRTFDTNANGQKDNEAVIIFEKNKEGVFVATLVSFS